MRNLEIKVETKEGEITLLNEFYVKIFDGEVGGLMKIEDLQKESLVEIIKYLARNDA